MNGLSLEPCQLRSVEAVRRVPSASCFFRLQMVESFAENTDYSTLRYKIVGDDVVDDAENGVGLMLLIKRRRRYFVV